VAKEIWRATEEQARRVLAEKGIELTEEETLVLLDHLTLYLDVALEECVLALARQQLRRREGGNGERPDGTVDKA
jgi:hypothetical protein